MNKAIVSIMAVGVFLHAPLAMAKQKVNESLAVDADSYVEIEHVNGKASIRGWDKNEVKVEGELSDRTEEFTFEKDGDEVRIEVEVKQVNWSGWKNWNNDEGDDLVIYVPHGSSISYESINANVDITEIEGDVRVEVVNGGIEVNKVSGRIRLESVNGAIEVDDVIGEASIETVNGAIRGTHNSTRELYVDSVNGDIRMTTKAEEIRAETVNGDLELTMGDVREAELTTVNGSIEAEMNLLDDGEVEATTVGGRVELVFQRNVSARFEIEGHAGGKIVNRITDDEMQKAKYGPRRWLNFSTGSASAQVDVSTVNGRVVLSTR